MRTCLILLSATVVGCVGQRQGSTEFVARYFASQGALPTSLPSCARPVEVMVIDGRQNADVAGVRFEEERADIEYPIRMQGDVASYVRTSIEKAFERAGRPPGASRTGTLTVKVIQLRIEEKVFYNSEYKGQIGLEAELALPGERQSCWTGRFTGNAKNYGRSGSEENYQETLNRALDNATAQLLNARGLPDALCGKCQL
jgi:hypothetical protein